MGAGALPPAARGRLIDRQRRGVGVVVALAVEAQALTGTRIKPHEIAEAAGLRVLLCGIGPEAARAAALQLVEAGVAALAVFGVAGGLDPALKRGELICPSTVLDDHGGRYAADPRWRSGFAAIGRDGALLTVSRVLFGPADKSQAFQRSGAIAVDMESAAVAAVARDAGLPLLVLRAISDAAGESIPAGMAGAVDRYGQPRAGRLAAALLRNPGLIPQLPRLAQGRNAALASLRRAARHAGPKLGYDHKT